MRLEVCSVLITDYAEYNMQLVFQVLFHAVWQLANGNWRFWCLEDARQQPTMVSSSSSSSGKWQLTADYWQASAVTNDDVIGIVNY